MTADGGASFAWTALGAGEPTSLAFLGLRRGWILVGRAGQPQRLLGTTDGGRTWTLLARTRDFAAVPEFLNDRIGYAISAGGGASGVMAASALVGTTDGGRTWQDIATDGYAPSDVDFLDLRHGYLAGWRCTGQGGVGGSCQGAILGTTDGGRSWQALQAIGTTRTGNVGTFALDFLSPAVGFAVLPSLQGCTMGGCLPALEATGDGGETWHTLQPAYQWGSAIIPGWPGAPIFTSPSAGWIALSPGAGPGAGGVLVTQDGGRSFRQFFARRFVAGSLDPIGNGAYAIASPTPSGSGGGQALVRVSTQGGVRQVWPAPAPAGGLSEDQGGTLHGIGLPSDAAALLGSGDGGRAWSLLPDLPGAYPWLVSFVGKGQGYLLAQNPGPEAGGVLYRTQDGGRRWRRVGQVLAEDPRYVRFFAGGAAVAVDYRKSSGAILRSTDGGRSWRRYGSLPAGYTWAVDFTSAARGYAYVGGSGSARLYTTADGGRHWSQLLRLPSVPKSDWPGSLMAFDRSGFGVVQRYGGEGQYLVTRDGGRSWYALDLPQAGPPSAIAVQGGEIALIETPSGLLRTSDGGRGWTYVP